MGYYRVLREVKYEGRIGVRTGVAGCNRTADAIVDTAGGDKEEDLVDTRIRNRNNQARHNLPANRHLDLGTALIYADLYDCIFDPCCFG